MYEISKKSVDPLSDSDCFNPFPPTAWFWYAPYNKWKSPMRNLRGEKDKNMVTFGLN
jgi:hypothetical protein